MLELEEDDDSYLANKTFTQILKNVFLEFDIFESNLIPVSYTLLFNNYTEVNK
jgi:hypothetical protein